MLCLCFKLEDECGGIFDRLRNETDWSVLALIDDRNQVIASTDPYQCPAGARVPVATGTHGGIVRFAGREYLAITREREALSGIRRPVVARARDGAGRAGLRNSGSHDAICSAAPRRSPTSAAIPPIFSAGLREIPRQADAIQRDLNRSVWNGSVRLSTGSAANVTFAKALLREISNMGRKTKDVFERSIGELHETAVSSVLQDSEFMAALAVELFARNLYERANDCRWWALNGVLAGTLAGREGCDANCRVRGAEAHQFALYRLLEHRAVRREPVRRRRVARRAVASHRRADRRVVGHRYTRVGGFAGLLRVEVRAEHVRRRE